MVEVSRETKDVSTSVESRDSSSPNRSIVRSLIGATSLVSFLAGLRTAYKHSKQPEAKEIARIQVLSGVGFAAKALAVATIITVSGFSLLVVGVSALFDVSSPKQFGQAMRKSFGESLRLPQSTNSQSFEDVLRSIESRVEQKKEAENSQ